MSSQKITLPFKPKSLKFKATSTNVFCKEGVSIPIDPNGWITSGRLKPIEIGLPLLEDSINFFPFKNDSNNKIKEKNKNENINDEFSYEFGKIKLNSVKKIYEKVDKNEPFKINTHYKFKKIDKSFNLTVPLVKNKLNDILNNNLNDIENEFPLKDIYIKKIEENKIEIFEEKDDDKPINLLIDPHEKDIFWTKEGAPFTRNEVDLLYSFHHQSDLLEKEKKNQLKHQLLNREKNINLTFQSQLAIKKQLEIINEEVKRIIYLGPGKGIKKKKSLWSEAAKISLKDTSSLNYRKNKWKDFLNFLSNNNIISEYEKIIIEIYRNELISGKKVNLKMFWRIINSLKSQDFTSKLTLNLIEYLRKDFQVEKLELIEFIEKKGLNKYFYESFLNKNIK